MPFQGKKIHQRKNIFENKVVRTSDFHKLIVFCPTQKGTAIIRVIVKNLFCIFAHLTRETKFEKKVFSKDRMNMTPQTLVKIQESTEWSIEINYIQFTCYCTIQLWCSKSRISWKFSFKKCCHLKRLTQDVFGSYSWKTKRFVEICQKMAGHLHSQKLCRIGLAFLLKFLCSTESLYFVLQLNLDIMLFVENIGFEFWNIWQMRSNLYRRLQKSFYSQFLFLDAKCFQWYSLFYKFFLQIWLIVIVRFWHCFNDTVHFISWCYIPISFLAGYFCQLQSNSLVDTKTVWNVELPVKKSHLTKILF